MVIANKLYLIQQDLAYTIEQMQERVRINSKPVSRKKVGEWIELLEHVDDYVSEVNDMIRKHQRNRGK